MKRIIFILAVMLGLIIGCKKQTLQPVVPAPVQKPCSIDITKIKDILWIPNDSFYAKNKFYSSGVFYQDGMVDGNWTVSNGCDSIKITRGASSYYYTLLSITNDTLKLNTPFSYIIYHK